MSLDFPKCVDQGFGSTLLSFKKEETPSTTWVPIPGRLPHWDQPIKEADVRDSVPTMNSKNGRGRKEGRKNGATQEVVGLIGRSCLSFQRYPEQNCGLESGGPCRRME